MSGMNPQMIRALLATNLSPDLCRSLAAALDAYAEEQERWVRTFPEEPCYQAELNNAWALQTMMLETR